MSFVGRVPQYLAKAWHAMPQFIAAPLRLCVFTFFLSMLLFGCADSPTPLPVNAPPTVTATMPPELTATDALLYLALAINPSTPPFDQPDVPALYDVLADDTNRADQRSRLATAGYPDGFALVVAIVDAPDSALAMLASRLTNTPLIPTFERMTDAQAQQAYIDNRVHAVIFSWSAADEYAAWQTIAGDSIYAWDIPLS